MLVSHILKTKGDLVFTVSPNETVQAAASLMTSRRVGALVVMDAGDKVAGIVSERDIVRLVAEEGADCMNRPVSTCMTREVLFAGPQELVDQLLARMTDRRVRHLPVCQDGRLMGLVSIGDLVKVKIAEVEAEAEDLKAYISGA